MEILPGGVWGCASAPNYMGRGLNLAVVGICTPWKLANTTHQGFIYCVVACGEERSADCSYRGPDSIFSFTGHVIPVAPARLCHCSLKAATDKLLL